MGPVVGRIMRAAAAPEGMPWLWTLPFGHHEDRTFPRCHENPVRNSRAASMRACTMPDLKNQHFVPRCLLRPFTHQGGGRAVNLYNIRHDRLIERASVKGQCARNYLYGKDGKIERSLARVEGPFNLLRARVMDGGNDPTDLHDLTFFAYLQLRRTEMAVQRLKESYELMTAGMLQGIEAPPPPSDHSLIVESLLVCLHTRQNIEDLKVRIVENRTDIDFVICDDPSIFMNRFAAQKLGDAGFGVISSGLILTMPIAPKFAVLCYDGQVYTVSDLVGGRVILRDDAAVEALNELQFLKAAENIYFNEWDDREYVRNQFLTFKDNRPSAWSTVTHLVPIREGEEGTRYGIKGESERYRVGTLEEAKQAGTSLIKMSFKYPVPTQWFPPLKFRSKPKTFYEGTGVGHVRKEEWLRPQSIRDRFRHRAPASSAE